MAEHRAWDPGRWGKHPGGWKILSNQSCPHCLGEGLKLGPGAGSEAGRTRVPRGLGQLLCPEEQAGRAENRHAKEHTNSAFPPHTQVSPPAPPLFLKYRTEPSYHGGERYLRAHYVVPSPTAPPPHRAITKARPTHCGAQGLWPESQGQAWLLPGPATALSGAQLSLRHHPGWEQSADPDSPSNRRVSVWEGIGGTLPHPTAPPCPALSLQPAGPGAPRGPLTLCPPHCVPVPNGAASVAAARYPPSPCRGAARTQSSSRWRR